MSATEFSVLMSSYMITLFALVIIGAPVWAAVSVSLVSSILLSMSVV